MLKTKRSDSVARSIVKYSSASVYTEILGVLNAFIKPKLLTPELYGLWNLLNLIPLYASYSHLGSRSSMRYLIPYNEGRQEHDRNTDIKGSVFYGALYLNILIIGIIVVFSFTRVLSAEVKVGLLAMAVVVIMTWYYGHVISLLKSYQQFHLITASNYLRATVTCLSSMVLIYLYSIYGAYVAAILSLFVVVIYLKKRYPLEAHARFRFEVFGGLVKVGFPIMLFSICSELIRTSDRIIISYYLGNEQLGYYGIATMAISAIIQIPGAAREIIEPKLMESVGKSSNEETITEYFFRPLINSAYLLPIMLGSIVILLPVVIPLLLPRYTPGVRAAQILVLGSYFFSLSFPARGIIVANNWQAIASTVVAFVLALNIAMSILVLRLGFGIAGVAFASSVGYFALLVCLLAFIRHKCSYGHEQWKTTVVTLCWPFPIMCGAILLVENVANINSMNICTTTIVKLSLYGTIMGLVLMTARRRVTVRYATKNQP